METYEWIVTAVLLPAVPPNILPLATGNRNKTPC